MPVAPLFIANDDNYPDAGHARVLAPRVVRELAGGGDVVFRSVHVADMPIHEIPDPIACSLDQTSWRCTAD